VRRLLIPLVLIALLLPAELSGQDSAQPAVKIKRHPDKITLQEIEAAPASAHTALRLVELLRSNWLRGRGSTSILLQTPGVQVYVAGMHQGGTRALEDIARGEVKEIQHLRGTDATQRFGSGHESGAILVILR